MELALVNTRLKDSNRRIKKAIKGLSSLASSFEQSPSVTPKILLSTRQAKHHDSSYRYDDSSKLVDEVQSQVKNRGDLIFYKSLIDNKEAERNYSNLDVIFNRTPIEIKQKILKAEDYNVSELDNVHQIWRKTARAIRILDNRQNESRRVFKNLNASVNIDRDLTDLNSNVNCLQAVSFGNDFEVDDEDFQRALEDDRRAFEEHVKHEHELERKKIELKHTQWIQSEKPRASSVRDQRPMNKVYFNITKSRSPHPSSLGMSKKQKEQYEKQLKVEFEEKSHQIENTLEKRNKYHESLGIFTKEKNKVRLEAKKIH